MKECCDPLLVSTYIHSIYSLTKPTRKLPEGTRPKRKGDEQQADSGIIAVADEALKKRRLTKVKFYVV